MATKPAQKQDKDRRQASPRTLRNEDISQRRHINKRLLEIFDDVEAGFSAQQERADKNMDYWDIFNNELGDNQYYYGTSKIFVPITHEAIMARVTRFSNQLFPRSGRYCDVTNTDGETPHGMSALLQHYIRKAKVKTQIARPLIKNGDIEGHYSIYVTWSTQSRHTVKRVRKPLSAGGMEFPGVDDIDDLEYETVFDEHPVVEVLNDNNVLVLPVNNNGAEDALRVRGGSVTVIWPWTKAQVRRLIDDGTLNEDAGEAFYDAMGQAEADRANRNMPKKMAEAAGIRERGKIAFVYETWAMLKVDGQMRLCRAFYGGDKQILGCKLCPFWNDRCPVISAPIDKVANTFKGVSKIKACAEMQYYANDMVNEGADSSIYSMLPITLTDPTKNPRVGTMVLTMAAVWEADPNSTKFASFPPLWRDAFQAVAAAKSQIFEVLGVNPAMMPQQTGNKYGGKRNQAEIALELQVDILTTADAVGVLEEDIFSPMAERFMELDAQYRTVPVTVKQYGMMGMRAKMEEVDPQNSGTQYSYTWSGVEAARNAAQIQQQIAAFNVMRGIPPQFYKGYEINAVPMMEGMVESAFGPNVAPNVFRKVSIELDPDVENGMLADGFAVPVSQLDDDQKHLVEHLRAKQDGDPHQTFAAHILAHILQQQAKAAAQMRGQPGQPGTPGGAAPGVPGVPRIGAQPRVPRQQGPPGMIHKDQLARAGAPIQPRKTA